MNEWMKECMRWYPTWDYCIMNIAFILWLHVQRSRFWKQFLFYCCVAILPLLCLLLLVYARFFVHFVHSLPLFPPPSLSAVTISYVCLVFLFLPRERKTLEFVKIDMFDMHTFTERLWYNMFNYSIISFYYFPFVLCSIDAWFCFTTMSVHASQSHSILSLCIVEIVSLNRQWLRLAYNQSDLLSFHAHFGWEKKKRIEQKLTMENRAQNWIEIICHSPPTSFICDFNEHSVKKNQF